MVFGSTCLLTSGCHSTACQEQCVHIREMRVAILFRSILYPFAVYYDRGYRNDNDKVEHMRTVKIERKKFIFEVSEKVVLGLTRIVLQLFNRIWHCTLPAVFDVARPMLMYARACSTPYSYLPCASGHLLKLLGPIEAVLSPMLSASRHDVTERRDIRTPKTRAVASIHQGDQVLHYADWCHD